MEIILATAFGAEAHSQTDENDKLTVLANKVLTRSPWLALLSTFRSCVFGSGEMMI